jgi:trehalose-6-phosphatase
MVLDPTIVEVVDARMALEVRPVGARTKADAVHHLISAARERDWATGLATDRVHVRPDSASLVSDTRSGPGQLSVVMMGDDVTDVQALTALTELAERDAGIKIFRVGVASSEMPDTLPNCVDVLVEDPEVIAAGLAKLADRWP